MRLWWGDGAAGSAGGRFRPGRWGWLLILVGAGAFLSMTELGHVIAIMCLIVIIGIPIYLLLAALPSIFLILLFLRLVSAAVANVRARNAAWGLAFAAAAFFMLDYFVLRAQRANASLDARAQALVAGDIAASTRIPQGGVLATVRVESAFSRAPEDVCDDLCQRLLLNGFATRVLVAAIVPPRTARGAAPEPPVLKPAPGLSGTMYWLEPRPVCPEAKAPDNVRVLRVDAPAPGERRATPRSVSETMRVKIASGTCLVSMPAALDQADGAFFHGRIANGGGLAYGFDVTRNTIDAWRTAYFRRDGDQWIAEHRATGVRYLRFPGALIPSYIHGAELRIYNGFLRSARLLGRERYADTAPVAETLAQLGVDLRIEDAAQSDGPQVVDDVLASKDPVPPLQAAIVEDYLGRLSSNRTGRIEPDDVQRVLAIVGDARISFGWNAQGAVARIAAQQPQLAPDLARLLFARLDAIVASAAIVSEQATRSAGALSNAIAALPDAALKPYFANIEAAANASALRAATAVLVARLDIFGTFAVPLMFRVMDQSLAERAPRQSNWRTGFSAGLRALCRLGGEGAFARPMLEERIRASGEHFVNANERLVVATLVRMGASEEEVRELLAVDEKRETRLKFAFRSVNGRRPCE